ncbi:MAG: ribosome biogenesis GTPase Der [Anaerococcus vaginalis]|uniref:ribosome biogenesis GTPase Der n=2 Tax=Anaerococcus vaginalis TaxID=33037 RepID=UPI0029096826|nr:ribosome biogenesis GTPase Der [Anaerococcus vaginalis]MDU4378242.1 ribosome biogenesis GTPase Der [Anaerococcus vaginalis]MDU6181063.1 ribosome biogenesis GTPase Der [Anaerococcus vaginalis]MDU7432095.1 ribosome biogenesis GTPase Der [Anaerococcus vaginalis]
MNAPIVTLVGRTNVGKSTLFNKLVGKRKAITEDVNGVTRDRVYDKVEWIGHEFILADTGGLDISNKELMNQEIKSQVEKALLESDLILFVVDGREGINPHDYEIADEIRKYNKKVIVVANKIDGANIPDHIYDFYQFGFDDLISTSAEGSKNLGDLLDKIVSFIDFSKFDTDLDATRIAIIGKPNAGKSSLVNHLLNEERMIVTDIAGTTRDAIDTYWQYKDNNYVLIDTAGLRRKNKVSDNIEYYANQRTFDAVDSSEICLFLIDATVGVTEQDTKIAGYAHNQKKAIIIAVNKWDKVQKETNTMKNMEKEIRNKLSFALYAPIIFISVLKGQRITDLLNLIEIVNSNYHTRIKTGVLNTILQDAIMMTAPPQDKGKRLKIFYISQVQTAPPKFLLHVNDKELMHFSYQRYLENQIRQNYSLQGVPFTFEIRERKEK